MGQRTIQRLLLCAGAIAFLPLALQGHMAYAQSAGYSSTAVQDPGDIYAAAFWLIREARILAEKQSYNNALQKGQEAERMLATIVRDYPGWKPNLVADRRKLLAESLAEYRRKAGRTSQITRHQPGLTTSSELPRTGQRAYDPQQSDYRPVPLPNYATTDRNLYHALARAQEECRRMAEAYSELNGRFVEIQKKLVAAQMEQKMYKERYEQLTEQIAVERQAGNSVVESLSRRYADMESKYHSSEEALKEARERAKEIETRLAQAQSSLERVTRERDSLLQENEKLRAIVELNSPEKTKALLDQNLTLAEQLKTAQEKIQQLEAMQTGASDENAVLARQLEETRAEAARLRDEMSGIYDENMGYRKRISELTEQLNNLEAELAARSEQPTVDPALAEENKLLRGIIEKQRNTLAMQEESRRLLLETYQELKKNDPDVLNALQKLQEESSPDLTPEERKILEELRKDAPQEEQLARSREGAAIAARRNLQLETLADLADKAFTKGRYISAEQLYLTLYDMQPDHVAGLVNLGTILLYNNKNEEALQYLTRAARLAPNMAICYHLSGIAHYRLEQMPEAQKMFARTVQLDPGNAEAFFYLANIEGIAQSFEKALKHYAAAVKIKPELADAHYNMARLYAETSRIPEAARAYDRAIHNGAVPDPDFENYLRRHPDNAKAPGVDLVETVKPEDEARGLQQEEAKQEVAKNQSSAPPATPAKKKEDTQAAHFLEQVDKISTPVEAAAERSPAGVGHETSEERFSTIRMRTRDGIRTLRLKRPEPLRIRARGGEEILRVKSGGQRTR